jgi:acetyl-CoA carboxylase biotin carboxyl carrier protein
VVAEGSSNTPGPFDVTTIKTLVALMSRHDISEIDLRQGDRRIRLLRGGTAKVLVSSSPEANTPPVSPAPPAAIEASPATSAPAPARTKPLYEIKSPTPGTFYAASSPDAESFVKVGSRVTPETVVCLIEAMKLFTEITADVNGVIAEILVQNQQPVEYGQVLFRVDTGG